MPSRREFMQAAAGGTAALGGLFESISRTLAIEPQPGSSFLDAEHVVILMQENRSFDHAFGTLRGVRGFNDPRAITLPDGNPVWVQADADGKRYAPFRFDIHGSKATWMGSLPHSWTDQVDARNHGLHDKWIPSKRSGHREYAGLPLTMGHYARADIPFYFALADAFTICDQYFCSSLTGTTPNRLYLWTGTIREKPSFDSPANVRNEEVDLDRLGYWPTFPERLESLGVSWKVYQNELTVPSGLSEAEDAWLANFGDNPIEYMSQFNVHLAPSHRRYVAKRLEVLPGMMADLKKKVGGSSADERTRKQIAELEAERAALQKEQTVYAEKSLDKLSPRDRALHDRAFCVNQSDPNYRKLTEIVYREGGVERRMSAPKGDVLHQFRKDVEKGQLPTVSWLVSPETFSDHPTSAWFGAWYIAEVMNILTQNPDVWKKTIFLLTYDENDGYFDHVPPFVAAHPKRPETGKATKGIDLSLEFVELAQDRKRNSVPNSRESAIGLGYRVPMLIASPWSRGGCVCSQVFDHTSVLQLLEKLLSHKLGKLVEEPNITKWRRTVCGDLTSSFQKEAKVGSESLTFPSRDAFLQSIHEAQFQNLPGGMTPLSQQEMEQIRRDPAASSRMPRQEPGTRPSAPLPYELVVNGSLDREGKRFAIRFEARKDLFGERSAGSPFRVQAFGYKLGQKVRDYAVEPGEALDDSWALADFEGGRYHLRVDGPNGFLREFKGDKDDPHVEMKVLPTKPPGGLEIHTQTGATSLEVRDNLRGVLLPALTSQGDGKRTIGAKHSSGWYDFTIKDAKGGQFQWQYAGRVETGQWSTSDPGMGR